LIVQGSFLLQLMMTVIVMDVYGEMRFLWNLQNLWIIMCNLHSFHLIEDDMRWRNSAGHCTELKYIACSQLVWEMNIQFHKRCVQDRKNAIAIPRRPKEIREIKKALFI